MGEVNQQLTILLLRTADVKLRGADLVPRVRRVISISPSTLLHLTASVPPPPQRVNAVALPRPQTGAKIERDGNSDSIFMSGGEAR